MDVVVEITCYHTLGCADVYIYGDAIYGSLLHELIGEIHIESWISKQKQSVIKQLARDIFHIGGNMHDLVCELRRHGFPARVIE